MIMANSEAPNEAAWQVLDRATAQRKLLLDAGYVPLPANGKAPSIKAWSAIQPTEDDICKWEQEHREATNTGIQTRTTPAVDIDCLDPKVADELQELLWSTVGDNGQVMVRYGRPPKRAILFQTDMPFFKIATPTFTSPDQCKHRVEILCDGQQVIVFGKHPDTGQYYRWSNGEPGAVGRDELPYLNETLAKDFVAKATELMRAKGWTEDRPKKGNGQAAPQHGAEFDSMYGDREQKYALAALDGCAADLAGATKGERNAKLNAVAFRMGTLLARRWIARDEVVARLLLAAHENGLVADDGEAAARKTLQSGLEAGEARPHSDLEEHAAGTETRRESDTKASCEIIACRVADVEAKPVDWLWDARIARGKLTLVAGEPGLGKSQIGIDLHARLSAGALWPDGTVRLSPTA